MNPIDLTPQQLRQAASIKEKIYALEKELSKIFGGPARATSGVLARRRMSAAGRAAIAAAARARWAKYRSAKPVQGARKPRRKLSAAAKARLSALATARWKKAKAAGKKRL